MEKIKLIFKDLSLFLSAFVPMFFLILLRLIVDMLNNNLHFNFLNTLNLITLLLLIGCGTGGLWWNISSSKNKQEIEIISAQNITDEHFFGYFSLFVLFALQFNLALVSGYVIFVVIMIFIGIVYIKNDLFYINPLLNILGYNFYDVTYINSQNEQHQTKIFHKGQLKSQEKYYVNIKNNHFTFIDTKTK